MVSRFKDNKRRLIGALKDQAIVRDEKLAERIVGALDLIQVDPGEKIVSEDGEDDDLFFILAGRVSVQVRSREVAVTGAGEHFGEMALIDSRARRSASVIALERSVLGRISESASSKLANDFPQLWRYLAVQLGIRLRQRNDLIAQRNPRPVIFIGSSVESITIARAIQSDLQYDGFIVRPRSTAGLFGASSFPIDDLELQIRECDFAVLVFGPDDRVVSRATVSDVPRDNVVFELGLFMGALRRQRTFIVLPRDIDIRVPSDLLGLTKLSYAAGSPDTLADRIGPVCNELRSAVKRQGAK